MILDLHQITHVSKFKAYYRRGLARQVFRSKIKILMIAK